MTTSGGTTTYLEGGAAVFVDDAIVVEDVDSDLLKAASVTITGGSADDVLALDTLIYTGTAIRVVGSGDGSVSLAGEASVGEYQAALRAVTYENTSDDPVTSRVVTFAVTDTDDATGTRHQDHRHRGIQRSNRFDHQHG